MFGMDSVEIRELKQGQRKQLRKCCKTIALMSKNNSSARFARAVYVLIHFIAVLYKQTTA